MGTAQGSFCAEIRCFALVDSVRFYLFYTCQERIAKQQLIILNHIVPQKRKKGQYLVCAGIIRGNTVGLNYYYNILLHDKTPVLVRGIRI